MANELKDKLVRELGQIQETYTGTSNIATHIDIDVSEHFYNPVHLRVSDNKAYFTRAKTILPWFNLHFFDEVALVYPEVPNGAPENMYSIMVARDHRFDNHAIAKDLKEAIKSLDLALGKTSFVRTLNRESNLGEVNAAYKAFHQQMHLLKVQHDITNGQWDAQLL